MPVGSSPAHAVGLFCATAAGIMAPATVFGAYTLSIEAAAHSMV